MKMHFLVAALLVSGYTYAQSPIEGTWSLQNKEYLLGPEYGNALARQVTLKQQADSLVIETVSAGAEGQDVNNRSAVGMDGKQVSGVSNRSQRKYTKSIKWNPDKKGFIMTTVIYLADNPTEVDFTRVETWSLSPDGKQLKIHKKSLETRSETWEAEGTYTRTKK